MKTISVCCDPWRLGVFLFFCAIPNLGNASTEADEKFGLKKVASAVVNAADEPIYAQAVERGFSETLLSLHRFEVHSQADSLLKQYLNQKNGGSLGEPQSPQISSFPVLMSQENSQKLGVQALVLGEIKKADGEVGLLSVLVNANTFAVVASAFLKVEDPERLESFYRTAKASVMELDRKMPFDAVVVSRKNDRVVLDRGMPYFRQGMRAKVFTLESWDQKPSFRQVGVVLITRVEKHLSFGKVEEEIRPNEIQIANQILLGEKLKSEAVSLLPDSQRAPAMAPPSTTSVAIASARRGALGVVEAKVGMSQASFQQSLVGGESQSTGNHWFPTLSLLGEVFLTKDVFFNFGFQFANANVTNPNVSGSSSTLGSSLSSWRGKVGYHVYGYFDDEPWIDVTLGYGSQKYSIGTAPEPFLFATSTYTGLLLGGVIRYPLTAEIGVGLDFQWWLFPAISEFPVTGGSSQRASGIDFGVKGYYQVNSQFTLEGRFTVMNHAANFEGQGSRPKSLTSADHSVRQLLVGVSYFY